MTALKDESLMNKKEKKKKIYTITYEPLRGTFADNLMRAKGNKKQKTCLGFYLEEVFKSKQPIRNKGLSYQFFDNDAFPAVPKSEHDKLKKEKEYWERQYNICNLTSANVPKEKVREIFDKKIRQYKKYAKEDVRAINKPYWNGKAEDVENLKKQLLEVDKNE